MKKVAAIVPALNEQDNIERVLKVLLSFKGLSEVIVVDGGSSDKTLEIAKNMGAKVVFQKIGGKGVAMKKAVMSTDADIVVFFDADLIGLKTTHISSLIDPLLQDKADMCVGVRGRHGFGKIAYFLIKIDPLFAIAGERAIKREILENIPEELIQGFMVETALNYYCKKNKLRVSYVWLDGLEIVVKEKKWGFWKGLLERIKMIYQIIKVRILISKKFKSKNLII
jgi:glycosyltransferase involved in cell wall biosynthesis